MRAQRTPKIVVKDVMLQYGISPLCGGNIAVSCLTGSNELKKTLCKLLAWGCLIF